MDFLGWYHQSCISHMYEHMNKPLPESVSTWAKTNLEALRNKSEEEREAIPLLAVVLATGIDYGIRSLLERSFVAFPEHFTHDNVEQIARSLVLSEAMRKYNLESIFMKVKLHLHVSKQYTFGSHRVCVQWMYMGATAALNDKQVMQAYFVEDQEIGPPPPSPTKECDTGDEEAPARAAKRSRVQDPHSFLSLPPPPQLHPHS